MSHNSAPCGRVVITGLGAICPLGSGIDVFWPRMVAGETGIRLIESMDASQFPTRVAGEVRDFVAEDWIEKKEARRIDRFISLAVASAMMAMRDADFPEDLDIRTNTGVMIGSGIGGLTLLGEQVRKLFNDGPSRVSPFLVPYMIPDMAAGYVSIQHKLRGPNSCVVTACATGASSIGDAYHVVKRGDAVAMLAGGTEAPINDIGLAGFCAARAMTTRNDEPERASRPFDKERDGFVIAEGSGMLLLEDLHFAQNRGARIYAEVVGYGATGDAFHITAPDPDGDGATRSMNMALHRAGIQPSEVDYINAHGTSTPLNDKLETQAIKRVMGEHAYQVPISSTKSMVGHMLGAAGAVEAVICVLAMRDGVIPPTTNYENPDPECDLNYTPNQAVYRPVNVAVSNSFGFGGHNVTLVLKKFSE